MWKHLDGALTPKPQVERAWGSLVGLGAAFGQAWDTLPCFLGALWHFGAPLWHPWASFGHPWDAFWWHFGTLGQDPGSLGAAFQKKNMKKVPKSNEKGTPNGVIFHEMCRLARGICGTSKTRAF